MPLPRPVPRFREIKNHRHQHPKTAQILQRLQECPVTQKMRHPLHAPVACHKRYRPPSLRPRPILRPSFRSFPPLPISHTPLSHLTLPATPPTLSVGFSLCPLRLCELCVKVFRLDPCLGFCGNRATKQ